MLSWEDVDPHSQDVARVNSPRSLEAMRRQGFEVTDLQKLPKSHFRKKGVLKEVADQQFRHSEEERLKRFEVVLEERRKLIAGLVPTHHRTKSEVKDAEAAVLKMREREQRLLQRLEQKKRKELMLLATAEEHYLAAIQERSKTPRRRKKQSRSVLPVSETPQPMHDSISQETTVPEPSQPAAVEMSDSEAALLAKVKRKIEAKERELALAKAEQLLRREPPPVMEVPVVSHSQSKSEVPSVSCDLEMKERRHREALRSLQFVRDRQRAQRDEKQRERREQVRAKEDAEMKSLEDRRAKMQQEMQSAVDRYRYIAEEKERRIGKCLSEDRQKQQQSRTRRLQFQQIEMESAQKAVESLSHSLNKSEELRLSRLAALRHRFELRNEQVTTRRLQAKRMQRIREYQRTKTLEKISADSDLYEKIKSARREEMIMKQRLRKELMVEKQQMAERMEKLMSGRGRNSVSPSLLSLSRRDVSESSSPEPLHFAHSRLDQSLNAQSLSLSTSKAAHTES